MVVNIIGAIRDLYDSCSMTVFIQSIGKIINHANVDMREIAT